MATVTSLTKQRMEAIEGASIVGGTIDGSQHLILTRFDGTEVDAGYLATGAGDMLLAGIQTITGRKIFNKGTLHDKGQIVYDVKAFGAIGNNSADDTAAIQAAIDAAASDGGGTVWFPTAGPYRITDTLKLYSGTTPTINAYDNIKIAGVGSVIRQMTTGVDIIKAMNDAANGAQSKNIIIENLVLDFGGTPTNSGHGINAVQVASHSPAFYQWYLNNVNVTNCQGSGKYGFKFDSLIVSTLSRCIATECANGFFFNGAANGAFSAINTSTTLLNCYANMGVNGVNGFRFVNTNYSSLISCAADYGANSGGIAYSIEACNSMELIACGFELGGTNTLATAFKICGNGGFASNQIKLSQCYGFLSNATKEIWITDYATNIHISGYQSNSSVGTSVGITLDEWCELTEENCTFSTATARAMDLSAKRSTPSIPRVQYIENLAAGTPACAQADLFFVNNIPAAFTMNAPTGNPRDAQYLEIQYRDNGGGARTIAHNAAFIAGAAEMLTTTVVGKTVREIFQYSAGAAKWICMTSNPAGW